MTGEGARQPGRWQALIAAIPHRHAKLLALLAGLDAQAQPGFSVLLYRDNLQASTAAKRQALLTAASAEYVSFIDDDDAVMPGYVPLIMAALCEQPDYIGFPVLYEVNGAARGTAEHSIRYDGWHTWPERMVRDISHLNPLRRDIAVKAGFGGGPGEDARWADAIRASGLARTETWIPQPLYRYRYDDADCHRTPRKPVRGALPALPRYPWLEVMTA